MSGRTGLGLAMAIALFAALISGAGAEAGPVRSEERLVSTLALPDRAELSEFAPELRIPFTLPPGADPRAVELILSATPRAPGSGGRIEAFVNTARPVTLAPRPEPFEARFALYSDDLRAGDNELVLRFEADGAQGWRILTDRTRLRIDAATPDKPATLSDLEAALAADFAAPRRVRITADDAGAQALIAQGLALRLGVPPLLTDDPALAQLEVIAAPGHESAVAMTAPGRLVLSGETGNDVRTAARAFAAHRFETARTALTLAKAETGPPLVHHGPLHPFKPGLSALAREGAPFADGLGARAAIVISTDTEAERAAALAVLSRAALASGRAWTDAWYGDDADETPHGYDVLALGPLARIKPDLLADAPPELRAAARAAQARAPRRPGRFGSAAFASEPANLQATGLAGLYETGGRTIALITAPDGSDFARAAHRLAHSPLWTDLDGRAALWDGSGVIAFSAAPAAASPGVSMADLASLIKTHARLIALIAFMLGALSLLAGLAVNARSRSAR